MNIKQSISDWGFPDYRYKQLVQTVFKQRIGEFRNMKILPQELRNLLERDYGNSICTLYPVNEKTSKQVKKILFAMPDNNKVEAVALRYKRGWESFCISSQCGCAFGCKFCATGAIGFKRNMTAKEIVDQLLYFHLSGHELDSISFMGMGEPLSNPNTFKAIKLLTDPNLFGLGQRKITVSTVGIPQGIRQMTKDFPQVNLAFSLHSPFNEQRNDLMPVNRKYPLHTVMEALNDHIKATNRKVFIAYIMLDEINDTLRHAEELSRLIIKQNVPLHLYHVDLIPYNSTKTKKHPFKSASATQINKFAEVLKSNGISVSTRVQFGSDISAACGQLYGEE